MIVLLDYNSKDISVFAFGFFCLQLPRFVFCICAVLYDDRGIYASRRCLSISILLRGMTILVFVILARLSPVILIVLTICYIGLLHALSSGAICMKILPFDCLSVMFCYIFMTFGCREAEISR